MDRRRMLFEALKQEIVKAKIQHVQLLLTVYDHKLAFKFVSVDSDKYRAKVKEITDRYCESLCLAKETKTTLTYLF